MRPARVYLNKLKQRTTQTDVRLSQHDHWWFLIARPAKRRLFRQRPVRRWAGNKLQSPVPLRTLSSRLWHSASKFIRTTSAFPVHHAHTSDCKEARCAAPKWSDHLTDFLNNNHTWSDFLINVTQQEIAPDWDSIERWCRNDMEQIQHAVKTTQASDEQKTLLWRRHLRDRRMADNRQVLSAAHCVWQILPQDFGILWERRPKTTDSMRCMLRHDRSLRLSAATNTREGFFWTSLVVVQLNN